MLWREIADAVLPSEEFTGKNGLHKKGEKQWEPD
jgi:hypothetical protein